MTENNSLTHSAMQTYKTCPRKYYLGYELAIRPEREAHYFRVGGCVHLGLELRAGGKSVPESIALATAQYDIKPDWADENDWNIERIKVEELLRGYFNVYGEDMSTTIPEQVFELPILNPATGAATNRFTFRGKIDGVVRLADGRLAIIEHKTTSDNIAPDGDYWKRLKIDTQISGYFDAAQRLGTPVETVIYDVIRKPTIYASQVPLLDDNDKKIVLNEARERVYLKNGEPRQSAGDGMTMQKRPETPEEFRARLANDIAIRPEFYYARQEIPRLVSDVDMFREEIWQIQQQIGEARNKGRWFRNTASCLTMGKCQYFDICTGGLNPERDTLNGFQRVDNVHQELE